MADPLSYRFGADYEIESDDSEAEPMSSGLAAAEYLRDMTGQLEGLARRAGFDLLAYLLSMARVEAETHARALDADLAGRTYDA